MPPYKDTFKNSFIGRVAESSLLTNAWNKKHSCLTVVYGRRRIGKSTLIKKVFPDLLHFEGLENQNAAAQKKIFCEQLAQKFNDSKLRYLYTAEWRLILIELSKLIGNKPCVILFDEFQWMAGERTKLVSDLKFVWDNYFLLKNNCHMILCGSVSSFLVKKVIRSKALYGRVDLTLPLEGLSLPEIIKDLEHNSKSGVPVSQYIENYFVCGGVPAYWKKINLNKSPRQNCEELAFTKNGYFVEEFEKIFTSHFGKHEIYQRIVKFLSKHPHSSQAKIEIGCNLTAGGRNSNYLEDLELAGFIKSYIPVAAKAASNLKRYIIQDNYLKFYLTFIEPNLVKIKRSGIKFTYVASEQAIATWKGLQFEKLCLDNADLIAEILGFSGIRYDSGSFFERKDKESGFQIDLMFIRADSTVVFCEIKYLSKSVGTDVIQESQRKVDRIQEKWKYRVLKVLISKEGASEALKKSDYFDYMLSVEEVF